MDTVDTTPAVFSLYISPTQLMEMQFLHYAKVDLFAKEVCRRAFWAWGEKELAPASSSVRKYFSLIQMK